MFAIGDSFESDGSVFAVHVNTSTILGSIDYSSRHPRSKGLQPGGRRWSMSDVRGLAALLAVIPWTVLVGLRVDGVIDWSWWTVFTPCFVMIGVVAYLELIIGSRLMLVQKTRAWVRWFAVATILTPTIAFAVLLAQKLNGETDRAWGTVFAPGWVLLTMSFLWLLTFCLTT